MTRVDPTKLNPTVRIDDQTDQGRASIKRNLKGIADDVAKNVNDATAKIEKQNTRVFKNFESIERKSLTPIERKIARIRGQQKKLNLAAKKYPELQDRAAATTAKLDREINQLERSTKKYNRRVRGSNKALDTTGKAMRRIGVAAAAIGVGLSARSVIQYADSWQRAQNRISLVTGDVELQRQAQESLFQSANKTFAAYEATADLYSRISRSTTELELSEQRRLSVTETINQAIAVSGSTRESANAAIVQLGQGLAANSLRGQELNSVMEQTPRLARAIAEGLNTNLAGVRELAKDGELSAEKVFNAVEKQSDGIRREFESLTPTFAQISQAAENSATRLSAAFSDGFTEQLRSGYRSFVDLLNSDEAVNKARQSGEAIGAGLSAIKENWEAISAAIGVAINLATAFGAIKLVRMVSQTKAVGGAVALFGTIAGSASKKTALLSIAQKGLSAAFVAFGIALRANPIGATITGIAVAYSALKLASKGFNERFIQSHASIEMLNNELEKQADASGRELPEAYRRGGQAADEFAKKQRELTLSIFETLKAQRDAKPVKYIRTIAGLVPRGPEITDSELLGEAREQAAGQLLDAEQSRRAVPQWSVVSPGQLLDAEQSREAVAQWTVVSAAVHEHARAIESADDAEKERLKTSASSLKAAQDSTAAQRRSQLDALKLAQGLREAEIEALKVGEERLEIVRIEAQIRSQNKLLTDAEVKAAAALQQAQQRRLKDIKQENEARRITAQTVADIEGEIREIEIKNEKLAISREELEIYEKIQEIREGTPTLGDDERRALAERLQAAEAEFEATDKIAQKQEEARARIQVGLKDIWDDFLTDGTKAFDNIDDRVVDLIKALREGLDGDDLFESIQSVLGDILGTTTGTGGIAGQLLERVGGVFGIARRDGSFGGPGTDPTPTPPIFTAENAAAGFDFAQRFLPRPERLEGRIGAEVGEAVGSRIGSALGPLGSLAGGFLGRLFGGLIGPEPSGDGGQLYFDTRTNREGEAATVNNSEAAQQNLRIARDIKDVIFQAFQQFRAAAGGNVVNDPNTPNTNETLLNILVNGREGPTVQFQGVHGQQNGNDLLRSFGQGPDAAADAARYGVELLIRNLQGGNDQIVELANSMLDANASIEDVVAGAQVYSQALETQDDLLIRITRNALLNGGSLETISEDFASIQAALSSVDEDILPFANQIEEVGRVFEAARDAASKYGESLVEINQREKQRFDQVAQDFDEQLRTASLNITDPIQRQSEAILRAQIDRIKEANSISAVSGDEEKRLGEVLAFNRLEMKQFIEQTAQTPEAIIALARAIRVLEEDARAAGQSSDDQLNTLDAARQEVAGAFNEEQARLLSQHAEPTLERWRNLLRTQAGVLEQAESFGGDISLLQQVQAQDRSRFFGDLSDEQILSLGDYFGEIEDVSGRQAFVLSSVIEHLQDINDNAANIRQQTEEEYNAWRSLRISADQNRTSLVDEFGGGNRRQTIDRQQIEFENALSRARDTNLTGEEQRAAVERAYETARNLLDADRQFQGSTVESQNRFERTLEELDNLRSRIGDAEQTALARRDFAEETASGISDLLDLTQNAEVTLPELRAISERLGINNDLLHEQTGDIKSLLDEYIALRGLSDQQHFDVQTALEEHSDLPQTQQSATEQVPDSANDNFYEPPNLPKPAPVSPPNPEYGGQNLNPAASALYNSELFIEQHRLDRDKIDEAIGGITEFLSELDGQEITYRSDSLRYLKDIGDALSNLIIEMKGLNDKLVSNGSLQGTGT